MRFYHDLADWWPLFSPSDHYTEEAEDLLRRLAPLPPPGTATLLELGAGGGSLASHLKSQFKLTLTDLSEGMLAQNRLLNPEAEFVAGDMRTLRLNRQFDYVLLHDAGGDRQGTVDALYTILPNLISRFRVAALPPTL